MNTENMIDITNLNLRKLVQGVYGLSDPVGRGYIHYTNGPLSDDQADAIIEGSGTGNFIICMDYVGGRCCKFNVWKDENNRLWIRNEWDVHTDEQLKLLLDIAK